jgi:alkylation response protein AidB-like acyl-CoA dehydrogenase
MSVLSDRIDGLVAEWMPAWKERLVRRRLDPADFEKLREAGYLSVGVPVEFGGLWESPTVTTRPVAGLLRNLAHVDPSLALVCAMHPAVLSMQDGGSKDPLWQEQRRWISQTVLAGAFWGTVVSEPGSGGDPAKTIAEARLGDDGRYLLSGRKHFGSGSGITSFMITTGVPEGETYPATFYLDVRGVPWDGSAGMRLAQDWEGWGMSATQSHAFEFSDFPAIRSLKPVGPPPMGFFNCACSAIILGVVETAMDAAAQQLKEKVATLRALEKIEWANVEMEAWLIAQAYEGMLRAIERHDVRSRTELLQGKTAIAQIAESAMTRLCRVMGGGSYSRQSPYGHWFEDVRALGFLRPPWGMAYDNLLEIAHPAIASLTQEVIRPSVAESSA